MSFRVCLYRIGEQLTRQSLDYLMFLCQLTGVVSVSRIEQIRSATDLFTALEEKGKLSNKNLEFLAQLLTSIEQTRLISFLTESGFPVPQPVPKPTSQDYLYTECLLNIAKQLSSTEVERLIFILGETYLNVSKDHVFSATQLFKMLHQRQLVTPSSLAFIEKNLHEIGRTDLCQYVNEYHQKIGQPTHAHLTGQEMQAHYPARSTINTTERPNYQHVSPIQESQPTTPPFGRSYSASSASSVTTPNRSMSGLSLTSSASNSSMTSGTPTLKSDSVYHHELGMHVPCQGGGEGWAVYYPGEGGPGPVSHDKGTQQSSPVLQHHQQQLAIGPQFTYLPQKQAPPPHMQVQQQQPGGFQLHMQPNYMKQRQQQQQQQQRPESMRYTTLHSVPESPQEVLPMYHRNQPMMPAVQSPQSYAFGLLFDPFEKTPGDPSLPPAEGQKAETNELLQELGSKQGELTKKEEEIAKLKSDLSEAHQRTEGILQERVGEVEVYQQSIRNLEDMLKVKNVEVQGLLDDLHVLHGRMETIQASNNAFDPEELYPMTKSPHGLCIIINNHQFFHPTDPDKAHSERGGAKIDEYNLTQTFRYLRYKVELHENLTSQQMRDLMMMNAQRDHSEYDSFICCILTHGETNLVHGADSEAVNLLDLAGIMKMCGSLRGKPKLFFIQACRGDSEDEGFEYSDIQHDAPTLGTPSIPQEADFFFGYATPQGNAAYRSRRHGSWYISELCKVLTKQAYTHNLSSMMKKVNFQVSKAFTKEGFKQAPEFVDRLRKEVHFFHFSKAQKQREQQEQQANH